MDIFKDSNGKRVKSGDTVLIESTYNGRSGQGQRCEVLWDEECGQYAYRYKVGSMYGSTDFVGVHRFTKVSGKATRT